MTDPKPVTDLSKAAVSLARIADRLPPGTHTITIVKPDTKGQPWKATVPAGDQTKAVELGKG